MTEQRGEREPERRGERTPHGEGDGCGDRDGAGRRNAEGDRDRLALARAWEALVATARRTVADGLVVGTSGNVSVRVGATVLVTPTGVPYDRLGPGDMVGLGLDGRQVLGSLRPTSELPLHLAVYRATGARAIVHTHAVHATAVSTLVDELPPIHYMTAALGGPVRVAPTPPTARTNWPGTCSAPSPDAPPACCGTTAPSPTATPSTRRTTAPPSWNGCAASGSPRRPRRPARPVS